MCPHVHDKCCSLGDEVKLKHMYDKHTLPILERRVAFVMRSIQTTLLGMLELLEVHPDLMVVSYATPRKVFYKERYCWSSPREFPTDFEKKGLKNYIKGMDKYIRKPKEVKKSGDKAKEDDKANASKSTAQTSSKTNTTNTTNTTTQTNTAKTRLLSDWKWNRRGYGRRRRRRWKSRRLTVQTPVQPDDPWTGNSYSQN